MKRALPCSLLLVVIVGLPIPFAGAEGKSGSPPGQWIAAPDDADRFDAAVPVAAFDLLYDVIRNEKLSPPVASRVIGYMGVGLYEAVVPGIPDHRSLGGQLNELAPLPAPQPHQKYHWPTVAGTALVGVLRALFASVSPGSLSKIDALEQSLGAAEPLVPRPVFARSQEQGHAIAEAIVAWAAADGLDRLNNCPYTAPVGAGLWVPTPPGFLPPLQPCWGQLRPFVLASGGECDPGTDPVYSTDPTCVRRTENSRQRRLHARVR